LSTSHKQIIAARDEGKAVLLVSLEMDEVLDVSDRILVMYEGEIVGELDPKTTTAEEIGLRIRSDTSSTSSISSETSSTALPSSRAAIICLWMYSIARRKKSACIWRARNGRCGKDGKRT